MAREHLELVGIIIVSPAEHGYSYMIRFTGDMSGLIKSPIVFGCQYVAYQKAVSMANYFGIMVDESTYNMIVGQQG